MGTFTRRLGLALAAMAFATTVLAATVAELTDFAVDLDASYAALDATVSAREGSLADAQARQTALEQDRKDLHAQRDAQPTPCGCDTLDSWIADVDDLAAAVSRGMTEWEEVP